MSDFFSSIVKAIQDSVKPEAVRIGANVYSSQPLHHPPRNPMPDPIEVMSLNALVAYIRHSFLFDEESKVEAHASILIHVADPQTVYVLGDLQGRHKQRPCYLVASCKETIGQGFPFGTYLDPEKFIVNLQSQFSQTEARDRILQIVGNLKSGNVRTLADDGVSQEVTTSVGITRVADVKVPNPVALQPFRTFTEVEQPESEFILRMRAGVKDGEMPTIALFAADGNNWKLSAMQAVKNYLDEALEGMTVLA